MSEEVSNTEETQEEKVESINLNDIQALLQIVDIASNRGAFQTSEMSQIGAVYDKVSAFLRGIAESNQAEENTETEQGEDDE